MPPHENVWRIEARGVRGSAFLFGLGMILSGTFSLCDLRHMLEHSYVMLVSIGTLSESSKTVWPSGLRRWLKAPVRKGVGSNPTAVISQRGACCLSCASQRANEARGPGYGAVVPHPLSMREALGSIPSLSTFCHRSCLRIALRCCRARVATSEVHNDRALGVVVSHPLSMREALGSIPSVSKFC